MNKGIVKEIVIPALIIAGFFVAQSRSLLSNGLLFVAILLGLGITFVLSYQRREMHLFLFGAVAGFLVECRTYFTEPTPLLGNAAFMGVYYWMIVIWGLGFVLITRAGQKIRKV